MRNNDEQCHLYVVECINKRRKLLTQASSSLEERNHFHRLEDELLVEILCRLPCNKSAVQCSCVCKRWGGLISEPYFVRRFIASKLPLIEKVASDSVRDKEKLISRLDCSYHESSTGRCPTDLNKGERSFVMVARNTFKDSWKGLTMHLKDPALNLHNFILSPLPCLVDRNASPVSVVGACSDLLLCCRDESKRYDYYIYNIQTRQWLSLPSTPFYYGQYASNGFICDPFYSFEGGNVSLNATYRFSIVVADCPRGTKGISNPKVHLFSSNSSQWTTKVLLLPRPCRFMMNNNRSIAFGGMLYIRTSQGIIGFDPHEGAQSRKGYIQCHLIGWPPGLIFGNACIGVRRGQLQLSHFDDDKLFTTWLLKDYGGQEWSLLYKISLHQWVACERFIAKELKTLDWLGTVIGQHPCNPDIIYVSRRRSRMMCSILMCDISKRTVEVASHVAKSMRINLPSNSYMLMLPLWPTPLPTLV